MSDPIKQVDSTPPPRSEPVQPEKPETDNVTQDAENPPPEEVRDENIATQVDVTA
jgi:hypothetical protein